MSNKTNKTKEEDQKEIEIKEMEQEKNSAETKSGKESKQQKVESPIESLEKELTSEKEKYIRLFAEFENYKRRTSKERIELFKTAGEELMIALLPILDDFDRGISELKKSDDDELLKGMELINNKLLNTLVQKGLSRAEVNIGDAFDADIHDAITQIPAPNKKLKGKIIDVVEQGYKLGDKIIRFPKVVIGQ